MRLYGVMSMPVASGDSPYRLISAGPRFLNGTKPVFPCLGIIDTEIRQTSGIVVVHPKGTGYLPYPSRCRPRQAPRDFIRSSSSPRSDLNPAMDGARGK
jgi:hypothetical protein